MSLSKDLTDQFKQKQEQNYGEMDINFSILVLGTNFWPVQAPKIDFNIPADILSLYNRFQGFYQSKHSCVTSSDALLMHSDVGDVQGS